MPPTITVVIPTHNRRETCLLAVTSALEQSSPPVQVIVLADGCDDGTEESLGNLDQAVEVVSLPKAPGYAYGHRNIAFERARGDVVSWLGDDDLYMPDHLEAVGVALDVEQVELVQARACNVLADGSIASMAMDWRAPHYRELLLGGQNRTPLSAISHRIEPAIAAGGWDAERARGGDLDLWRRMLIGGARSTMLGSATVVHFRAAERQQSWPDRVVQNAAFLERLRDPDDRARIDAEIEAARQRQTAEIEAALAAERAERERLGAQAESLSGDLAGLAERHHEVIESRWWRAKRRLDRLCRR